MEARPQLLREEREGLFYASAWTWQAESWKLQGREDKGHEEKGQGWMDTVGAVGLLIVSVARD